MYLYTTMICLTILIAAGCKNSDNTNSDNKVNSEFNIDTAKKEIDEANRQFINLFNSSDSIGLANMFTVDGKSMEPNEPAFVGRSQIQTHYSNVMKMGANKLGLTTTGLWGNQDMLVEEGEYSFMSEVGNQLDNGKYIVLWKMEDGKWKLFRDCYNSDLPIPAIN
jgi:ketosteroid isomerase-like protein